MKTLLPTTIAVACFLAMTVSAQACSIRGQWCGYPLWAANAFEDPFGRVNPRTGPVLPSSGPRGYAYSGRDVYFAQPHYAPRRDRLNRHRHR